jgi:hypothetical protein
MFRRFAAVLVGLLAAGCLYIGVALAAAAAGIQPGSISDMESEDSTWGAAGFGLAAVAVAIGYLAYRLWRRPRVAVGREGEGPAA